MRTHRTPFAVIVSSAVAIFAGMAAMAVHGSPESDAVAGEMSTGVTVTATVPVAAVSKAVPAIKGPAPLPKEEQGLPGD